jgi:uncharacterized membrane protein
VRYRRNIVPTLKVIFLAVILVGNALCFAMPSATVNQWRKKKTKRRETMKMMMMHHHWFTVVVRALMNLMSLFNTKTLH